MAQDRYTRSARGKECELRLPGVCNGNNETTVFAHINGGGMGMKRANIHGSYACSDCHDVFDGRVKSEFNYTDLSLSMLLGLLATQEIMIRDGVLKL